MSELTEEEKAILKELESGDKRESKNTQTRRADVDNYEDRFQLVDRRDEEQILREMENEFIDELVYQFEVYDKKIHGKRMVTELSWAGVKETARRMGNVHIRDVDITDNENEWIVTCRAVDQENNFSLIGGAAQPKMMRTDSGRSVPDQYAYPKALSKAQRNALRNILPATIIKTMIAKFLEERAKEGNK